MTGKITKEGERNDVNEAAIVHEPGSSKKNKTGTWRTFRPVVTDGCKGCRICEWYCPEGAIKVMDAGGKKKAVIDYDYCKGCMICVNECPQKAVKKERER